MRKAADSNTDELDDLDDLDFSININNPSADGSKDDESGFQASSGWTALGTATEESKSEAFNHHISTPSAASISSDQFKHLNEEGLVDTLFQTANNPVACLFHLLFKGISLFAFLFLNVMLDEEILTFIVVVVFAAFDFWTVKNITGRLLVNLRWDSHIDQFGNEIYVYESDESRKHQQAAAMAGDVDAQDAQERSRVGATDSHIFWTATYCTPLIWGVFFLLQIFQFSFFWMVVSGICFSLSFSNAQGFYYCQRSHTARLSEYIQERGMTMFKEVTKSSMMPSMLSGFSLPSFMQFGSSGSKDSV